MRTPSLGLCTLTRLGVAACGFLNDKVEASGRPVGVAVDKQGALLVADAVGNAIDGSQAE
jgi:glucose/arabinose dehydrogenase